MQTFTLGVVSFVNSLPLYRTLEKEGTVHIVRAVPSQLEGLLSNGSVDAALLPVVDSFHHPEFCVVSDACIASDGDVRSVLMFTKVPPSQIRSVAADTSSHTSVALLKVLLADAYGVQPTFIEHAPDFSGMLQTYDAALLIGDPALEAVEHLKQKPNAEVTVYDLAAEWEELTGYPFVFAAWVARRDADAQRLEVLSTLLSSARDAGEKVIPQLAGEAALSKPMLSVTLIQDYLSHAIQFHLSPARRAGMHEFERRVRAHGLA
jgi:chorismate dehydratase